MKKLLLFSRRGGNNNGDVTLIKAKTEDLNSEVYP